MRVLIPLLAALLVRETLPAAVTAEQWQSDLRAWRDYAQRVLAAGEKDKAKALIEAGLKVDPSNVNLLELEQSL
jgi:hypothetical protein